MPIVCDRNYGAPITTEPYSFRQANKLSTVKKCLNEVLKYGGPFSPRDLYPVGCHIRLLSILLIFLQYQLALHQIDSMRKDGKFVGVDGSLPEGQAILHAHLNECHELLEMVRIVPSSSRMNPWLNFSVSLSS